VRKSRDGTVGGMRWNSGGNEMEQRGDGAVGGMGESSMS